MQNSLLLRVPGVPLAASGTALRRGKGAAVSALRGTVSTQGRAFAAARASRHTHLLLPSSGCRRPLTTSTAAASPGQPAASTNNGAAQQQQPTYDVVVIGGGSAGVRTARTAAEHGAAVALVELPFGFESSAERGGIGGTCVLRGCVPKKLLLHASEYALEAADSAHYGWDGQSAGSFDMAAFRAAKRKELTRLSGLYRDNLIKAGVQLLEGRARLLDAHTVQLEDSNGATHTLAAKNIVIATGGRSSSVPIPGAEHAITSDQVLELESLPRIVTLIGSGYISMEFAGMFARLGCEVHVVGRQAAPLAPRFDEQVCRFLLDECRAAGMHMHMGCSPSAIVREPDGSLTVRLQPASKGGGGGSGSGVDSNSTGEIRGNEQVVLAVGRAAKTAGLGLEEAGVEMGPKGSVKVDSHSRTNVPSIWAVGDVTSRVALTPAAIMEGQALGLTLATGQMHTPCYDALPSACFGWPYVATVGLTEQQAAQQGLAFEVYSKSFTPLKASLAAAAARAAGAPRPPPGRGFVKLLAESGSGRLLGLHVVGHDAPEIVQGYAFAIKLGATKLQLDSLVGIHPTAAEELLGMKGPDRVVGGGKHDTAGSGDGAAAAAGDDKQASSPAGRQQESRR